MVKFNDPQLNLAWLNRDEPMEIISLEAGLIHYRGDGFVFTIYFGDTPFNEIIGGHGFTISDYLFFEQFAYGSDMPVEFSITKI